MISPLLTDLYQLTMANGYFRAGRTRDQAVFHLFFRKLPFAGGYAIAAGLEPVLDFIEGFRFEPEDVAYLRSLTGEDGQALFGADFLDYLRALRLRVDIDAMPEGTLVFANEPILRVRGSLIEAQLLETTLLNLINFQTLVATKAARVCQAAKEQPVLEFGLRRAQGIDGALAASRAAFIGGCAATSNVLAGKRYGIPVRGTHAHSWVMSFDDEREAFEAYADAMPNNCVFLVDTYDRGRPQRHFRRGATSRAWSASARHSTRFRRPRLAFRRSSQAARCSRIFRCGDRRLERPRRASDRVAQASRRRNLGVGSGNQARDGLRPACTWRRLQALHDRS